LFVVGCSSQASQPVVVTPLPVTSSTPLPPVLPSTSPYFNGGFRSFYPQQFIGGPQQFFNGQIPSQYIAGPNVPQRFVGLNPYIGQFVPILQQSFDITPEGSYTFR